MVKNDRITKACTAEGLVSRDSGGTRRVYVPRVDAYETQDTIVLVADMPGVDDHSVNITFEKDTLTIKGSAASNDLKDHRVYYAEYGLGDYERVFKISEHVDHDRITASVKDGLLSVTLPKAEGAKARKIPVTMMQ
jgi:HSP20 family protein